MFGSLKKKLQAAIAKVTGRIESSEKPAAAEVRRELEKELLPAEREEEKFEARPEPQPEIAESVPEVTKEPISKQVEELDEEIEKAEKAADEETATDELSEFPEELKQAKEEMREKEKRVEPEIMVEKREERFPEVREEIISPKIEAVKEKAAEKLAEKPKEEKRGFFKRIVEKTLTESDVADILKELEMALIENDVAVEVAERIGADVKTSLLGKAVKRGGTEDAIKSALRDAMLDVLGQTTIDVEQRIRAKDRTYVLAVVGFNGAGKCVSGDTLIPLSDGQIVAIEDLYEHAIQKGQETTIEDGFTISNPQIEVFSVNPYSLRTEKVKAERIWKLRKDKLLRVSLENGQDVKVTPEHPFFVLKPGAIMQKRADHISTDDYVMVPKAVCPVGQMPSRLDLLKKVSERNLFVRSEKLVKEAYREMETLCGSLENAFNEIVSDANKNTFLYYWARENMLPSKAVVKLADRSERFRQLIEKTDFRLSLRNGRRAMSIPKSDADFYQWLGLFYAEGHLDGKYVDFTNSEDWLIEKFSELTTSVFGLRNIVVKPDYRNPNVKRVIVANNVLCHFLQKVVGIPRYKKSTHMELPGWVLNAPNELMSEFLKAYWEGDGCIHLNRRALEAATASEKFARQLSAILLRFGIIASMGKRKINNKDYYRIFIFGKEKLRVFYEKIGFLGSWKNQRLQNALSMPSQFEKTELIPMQAEYLRSLRSSAGILQQDLAAMLGVGPSLLCQYERASYQVAIPIERIAELSLKISSPFLGMLANADVRWVRVEKVEEVEGSEQWVYDFTIPAYHNFVANNLIVHNTTTLAKLAYKFKKFNPIFAAGDTFRAASIEQLEEHGRRLGVEVVKHRYGADSAAVIFDARKHAEAIGSKLVLADTAGRSHANTNLMEELGKVMRVNKPDLKVLVLDALTGNDIYDQANMFDKTVGIDAVILTKADVYEKGGAALSAAYALKKPILFLGVGQEHKDLQPFDAKKIVENLLG